MAFPDSIYWLVLSTVNSTAFCARVSSGIRLEHLGWLTFTDSGIVLHTLCSTSMPGDVTKMFAVADTELVNNSPGAAQLLQLYGIVGHTWFLLQIVFDPRIRSFQKDRKAMFPSVQCAAMSEELCFALFSSIHQEAERHSHTLRVCPGDVLGWIIFWLHSWWDYFLRCSAHIGVIRTRVSLTRLRSPRHLPVSALYTEWFFPLSRYT